MDKSESHNLIYLLIGLALGLAVGVPTGMAIQHYRATRNNPQVTRTQLPYY